MSVFIVFIAFVLPVSAAEEGERGWTFSGRFQGSSNESGAVLKLDPSLGYVFNRYVQTYAGVPIYYARQSLPSTSETGAGNAYAGLLFNVDSAAIRYASNLVVTAPTGDEDRGFSTGRVTADWTNTFSRSFSALTPFASVGVANTISDTSFFVRPFTSYGLVQHFEVGALVGLGPFVGIGASGYGVNATGEQRVVSKVVERASPDSPSSMRARGRSGKSQQVFESETVTIVPAELANDNGFSTWFSVNPNSKFDFQLGYSRSAKYDLDSFFFGIGFRVGK